MARLELYLPSGWTEETGQSQRRNNRFEVVCLCSRADALLMESPYIHRKRPKIGHRPSGHPIIILAASTIVGKVIPRRLVRAELWPTPGGQSVGACRTR